MIFLFNRYVFSLWVTHPLPPSRDAVEYILFVLFFGKNRIQGKKKGNQKWINWENGEYTYIKSQNIGLKEEKNVLFW